MNTKVVKLENEKSIFGEVIDFEKEKELRRNGNTLFLRINKKENIAKRYITLAIKRVTDIIGSIIGLIILIPLSIIIKLNNICIKDKGPLFYSHIRIGKDGKPFKMYKFRTMVIDADDKLNEMLKNDENVRKEWQENRKIHNDPRITKLGNALRVTSLDEWPNFISVLKGDMSIVGPRAVIPNEVEKFGIYKNDILSVKPGITGYWAANGRSNTSYEERVQMEYKYIDNFSILMDIKILFKTFISVIKKEGAV